MHEHGEGVDGENPWAPWTSLEAREGPCAVSDLFRLRSFLLVNNRLELVRSFGLSL